MQTAKTKIDETIRQYVEFFPDEFESFLSSTRKKEANLINPFAEFTRTDQMVRHLVDMPATLYAMMRRRLLDEEWAWLFSLDEYQGKRAGMTWFIRKYPQFKITKDF